MKQLWVYMCSPSRSPLTPPSPPTQEFTLLSVLFHCSWSHVSRLQVIVFTGETTCCREAFSELFSCPCSSGCRWKDSAWGWPRCTGQRQAPLFESHVSMWSWGRPQGRFRRTRRPPRGETHKWKMLYTSLLSLRSSGQSKQFENKREGCPWEEKSP